MPSLRPDQLLCIAAGSILCLLLPPSTKVETTFASSFQPPSYSDLQVLPVKKYTNIATPYLSSQAAIVFEPDTGSLLYQKNTDQSLPLASLTKLMTALVVVKNYDLNEEVVITSEPEVDGNKIKLVTGEKILVKDLLAGALIFSGNDAALALANHHPEGYDGFITNMNQLATNLHLHHTAFANPVGLDAEQQFSSPHDIAILTKALLAEPRILHLLGEAKTEIRSTDDKFVHTLYSTNELLGKVDGMIAGKTGSTLLAGECLMTVVNRNGYTIVTVVMGSNDRFTDTQKLIDWTYQNFTWTTADTLEYNTLSADRL